MIPDPKFAPARPDLVFLRRRVRPRVADPAPTSPAPSKPAGAPISYHRSDRDAAPRPSDGIDYTRPGRDAAPVAQRSSRPVDLTRRAPSGPAPAPVPAPAPAARSAPPAAASSSLDLSAEAAPAPRRTTAPEPTPPAPERRHVVRVSGDGHRLIGVHDPTVTLTRVQSGIGGLGVEAVCSAEVGDLRLGAAYRLRSGSTGIVQHEGGSRFAPSSRRPVLVASREEYEHLGVDLRQTDDIERIAIYAFSQSRTELTWGGTLVTTLFGGARLELPLETLDRGRVAMLLTISNLAGELVVRAEMETIDGDVREATRAYGFDRITWRDARTPVD